MINSVGTNREHFLGLQHIFTFLFTCQKQKAPKSFPKGLTDTSSFCYGYDKVNSCPETMFTEKLVLSVLDR